MAEPTEYWRGITDAHVAQLLQDVTDIKRDIRSLLALRNWLYGGAAAISAVISVMLNWLWQR